MNLYEFQTKQLFAQKGIPVPQGKTATSPQDVYHLARDLGPAVAVKAQVLTGGRMKAGGIRIATSPDEARSAAEDILGMDITGHRVHRVLVEKVADIAQEIYLGAIIDREAQRIMLMASAEGGIDIEEVAAAAPEKIRRVHADPFQGLRMYQGMQLAKEIGLPAAQWRAFMTLARTLFDTAVHFDADLVEINPLVITGEGQLLALDGKMSIDDNALPRQPQWEAGDEQASGHVLEQRADEAGLNFVYLGGNVACLGNGAGLAMATMDAVTYFGGQPANFLDIGGGATVAQVTQAIQIMTSDPAVRSLLVNISGGITRCDEVAQGLAAALEDEAARVPLVVRLVGTNEEEARAILAPCPVEFARTFTEVAQRAVTLAQENA